MPKRSSRRPRVEGCRKDIGPGVFRDRHGNIIPRSHFEEDPDFDTKISMEKAYAESVLAGIPRDFGLEEQLDMEKVEEYLARG